MKKRRYFKRRFFKRRNIKSKKKVKRCNSITYGHMDTSSLSSFYKYDENILNKKHEHEKDLIRLNWLYRDAWKDGK